MPETCSAHLQDRSSFEERRERRISSEGQKTQVRGQSSEASRGHRRGTMPSIASAYRGPLVIIGLGGGFSVVGAVPVAITFSIGTKTSATIIGMGFVGFGFLLILPGLFWCVTVRTHGLKFWRRRRTRRTPSEEDEATPTLNCGVGSKSGTRERHWPPSDYNSAPPLLIPSSLSSLSHVYDHTTTTTTTTTTTNCSSDVFPFNTDVVAATTTTVALEGPSPFEGQTQEEGNMDAEESDPATGSSASGSAVVKTETTPVDTMSTDCAELGEDNRSDSN